MVLPKAFKKPMKKSFMNLDCESNTKTNFDYADLISPAAALNEKEVCNSLGFFSTKAPKKKSNLKKVMADDLKNKRKRLENYFSTVDLDSWSERNFVLPNTHSENWHDDLHYIVLKQQQRSNLVHQLWLFLMLAFFSIMLISIAGLIYSKNGMHRNADESNSYEFMQKFMDEFNHTDQQRQPDPANRYMIGRGGEESNASWLEREAKYIGTLVGNAEDEVVNLTKKAISKKRSADNYPPNFKVIDHNNLNSVDYELVAEEGTVIEKIGERVEDSLKNVAKRMNLKKFLKKVQEIF